MSYIAPNTEITLCRNIPLDSSYDHTLTFNGAEAQFAYFYSMRYKSLGANTYQRVMSNRLRIQCTMEEAVQCNYMYFKNTNFENKMIYAFITGWEYINNITTEITYEIDIFQTFWFDIDIKSAFVEREHSLTDVVGANTVPEMLEQGEYVCNTAYNILPAHNSESACVLFYTTFRVTEDANGNFTSVEWFDGEYVSGIWSGLNVIKKNTTAGVQKFISECYSWADLSAMKQYGSLIEGIIAAFMCPFDPSDGQVVTNIQQFNKKNSGYLGTSVDPYQPRNKKLYCYPYNIARVSTDADTADYRYEDFIGQYMQFTVSDSLIPEPVITAYPYQYKGQNVNKNERITLKGFPQVALDVDVWKVYMSQHSNELAVGALSAAVSIAKPLIGAGLTLAFGGAGGGMIDSSGFGGSIAGNVAGLLGNNQVSPYVTPTSSKIGNTEVSVSLGDGSLTGVARSLAQIYDIARKPPQMNGLQSASADYTFGFKKFRLECLTIKAEYARIIDDYFTMYGYATHRVKTPNILGRPYWNYVKTNGIVLDIANAPQPYIHKMINCFNRGITFWHDPTKVGNYSLNNAPT